MASSAQDNIRTGVVVRLIRDKGFGFIKDDESGDELFFHRSAIDNFDGAENRRVRFQASAGPKGPRAERVQTL